VSLLYSFEALAEWADRKRVRGHLTDGRADQDKCDCARQNCLMAQAAADHFRHLAEDPV
jgi:hypothetical protein